ncbi:MAG TPA: carotenoid biosynthesis protein, partial [Ferruginibacter sp.]|nr:carotenoid biosynthesis protein [Ferruginibacter sp.]
MRQRFNRVQIATAIAILFHAVGLFGIFCLPRASFLQTTPLNLLLMFALLIYTQPRINCWYWIFFGLCFVTGIIVEWVGVHTGLLFGDYQYGSALGP